MQTRWMIAGGCDQGQGVDMACMKPMPSLEVAGSPCPAFGHLVSADPHLWLHGTPGTREQRNCPWGLLCGGSAPCCTVRRGLWPYSPADPAGRWWRGILSGGITFVQGAGCSSCSGETAKGSTQLHEQWANGWLSGSGQGPGSMCKGAVLGQESFTYGLSNTTSNFNFATVTTVNPICQQQVSQLSFW